MKFYTRMDHRHLQGLECGKKITLSPKVHDGGSVITELKFKTKKKYGQVSRAIEKGKGARLSNEDLDSVKCMNGEGFFDGVKSVLNSKITKGIAKSVAPMAGTMLASSGNPIAGAVATGALNGYAGSGLKRGRKKGGSFFDTLKSVANSKITKGIAKSVAPMAGTMLASSGNPIAGAVATGALNGYAGSGLKKKIAGGAVEAQQFTSLGGTNPIAKWSNPSEKMSYIRSCRGKKGGSFAPLG
jgi:hypothetical protein